jgi:hypothetical protein
MMLARQIGYWALAGGTPEGVPGHPMVPIWLDEDLDDKQNTLANALRRELNGWLPDNEVEASLFDALIGKQRILVILDRLSERSSATQQYISTIHGSLRVGAMMVTTRTQMNFRAETPTVIYPQPLNSSTLLHFMTSRLAQYVEDSEPSQKIPFPSIQDQLRLGERLATLITVRTREANEEVPILPLVVKLFVEQSIELVRKGRPLVELPRSLPDTYFRYLDGLNPKAATSDNAMSDEDMLRAAKLLGRLALENDFIPKEFPKESARGRLIAAGWANPERLDPIQRPLDNGLIIEKTVVAVRVLRFVLDPIAEFLAAASWSEECGNDPTRWDDLESKCQAASGFQLALRLVKQEYSSQLGWNKV